MGMFDHYQPRDGLSCPECAASLDGLEWQGKCGPCGLKTYVEKKADAPSRITNTFVLYTTCQGCEAWVNATGVVNAKGQWCRTVLDEDEDAENVRVVEDPDHPELWP